MLLLVSLMNGESAFKAFEDENLELMFNYAKEGREVVRI